jgi:putative hydrolase of the HAD superfamily
MPARASRKAVLFDLDDTLFDHRGSARAALSAVHRLFAPSVDFAAFERHHARYLEEMHLEVLAGRVGLDEARRERFRRVFAALGLPLPEETAVRVALAYRDGYQEARRPVAGAAALLAAVRARSRVAVVTNNLLAEQRDKLAVCGLAPFVEVLVASEDVGVAKPDPWIFRLALDRLGVSAADAVMVGDSWHNDIAGALGAGLDAIWFNPLRMPPPAQAAVPAIDALEPAARIAGLLLDGASR